MTKRSLSRSEIVSLIRNEPDRRSIWSVLGEVYRKNASFRFLAEFAGISLVVIAATGLTPTGHQLLARFRSHSQPSATVSAASQPEPASIDPRETELSKVVEALEPIPAGAPTPSFYKLGFDAVAKAPPELQGRLYFALELYRRRVKGSAILEVIKDLDPAEPNTALVRGLATISLGGPQNAAAGIADLKRAAEAGVVPAEALYGLSQITPPGVVERNPSNGRQWLEKAAKVGDHGAQYVLGYSYLSGWAGVTDPVQAAKLIKAAADGGDVEAMKRVAGLYLMGLGVPKDVEACEHYLRKAMETGDVDAQGLFGAYLVAMSVAGWGQSLDEGAAWLRKAAEAGNPKATHMLGMVQVEYAKNPPLRNLRAGVDWFERCAALEDTECEFAVGHAYAEGIGRAKNLILAARSFALAARDGSAQAEAELAKINNQLPEPDRAVVRPSRPDPGAMSSMSNDPRLPSFADTLRKSGL